MVFVLSHRGLEPSNPNFLTEGTVDAFESHLSRGFGIEFDVNFTLDKIPIIFHDSNLKRITNGQDNSRVEDVPFLKLKKISKGIPSLENILFLLKKYSPKIGAMHIRGSHQKEENLKCLIKIIERSCIDLSSLILFDLIPKSAKYLKSLNTEVVTAASVAHPFDIKRYSKFVNNTLISIDDVVRFYEIYDWVWLDEWDTLDENGNDKKFYTRENFDRLRSAGYNISLVTPELHRTSPSLYGGESHEHAKDLETLFNRISEIISLEPDAICTDYPEEVRKLVISRRIKVK
ncbi:MAG: glycerophosphodiester phosphodiesterase family protein [Candidatus Nanoarchaeia archaeon]